MIKSQKIINFKHIEIFRNYVRDWVELDLDHIESGYVELLALIGKGMYRPIVVIFGVVVSRLRGIVP